MEKPRVRGMKGGDQLIKSKAVRTSPTTQGQFSPLVVHSQVSLFFHAYAPPIIYAKLTSKIVKKWEGGTLLRRMPRR
jgi:hypothetical protein